MRSGAHSPEPLPSKGLMFRCFDIISVIFNIITVIQLLCNSLSFRL